VSVTIYYRKHELDAIKAWLSRNYNVIKSVSFLLHNEHGFDQAPLEEITEKQYLEMSSKVKRIDSIKDINFEDLDISECDNGACPIR
jgi:hypothetical protein